MAVEVVVKTLPVMVSMNPAPPAVTEEGLRLEMAGVAGLMVMLVEFDQP